MTKYLSHTLLAFVSVLALGLNAQTSEEESVSPFTKFAGASFIFSSESASENPTRGRLTTPVNFFISPYIGVNLTNRASIGGGLTFGYTKLAFTPVINGNISETRFSRVGVTGFVRNYVNEGAFRFFIESSINYTHEKIESRETDFFPSNEIIETTSTRNNLGLAVTPAVCYDINRFRLLARFGGLRFDAIGDQKNKETSEIIASDYAEFSISFFTRNISLGGEFLF